MAEDNHNKRPIDELTGFEVLENFEKFNQRNDIYCRSQWDPDVMSEKASKFFQGYFMPDARSRKTDGFSQRDYALRNAAWHVTNVLRDINRQETGRKEGFFDHFTSHEPGWPEPCPFESAEQASDDLRKVATLCGADLLGVCAYDERWMYSEIFDAQALDSKPLDIPTDLPHVIVVGESMDVDLTKTVPSALSGSATGLGYSYDALTILTLTQYIRNLGYRAYGTMNDSSLGRIFTDMPLVHDQPKKFGVKAFCDICDRCASGCPPKAIPFSEPSTTVYNRSNLIGVSRWTVDAEKCFKFWTNQNTDCSICIRVCPYNRDYSKWYNRWWKKLAGSRLRKLALWLDDKLLDRGRHKSSWWWQHKRES